MRWDEIRGQDRAVRLLRGALVRGQAHHAYLFAGPAGAGKEKTARAFAQEANCLKEPAEERPCDACENCRAIARGNFTDVSWHIPQSEMVARGLIGKSDLEGAPSKDIRVDEIRALARRLSLAPLRGRRKIAVLLPADAMNERAQNTLLKTLEEPPPSTTFVLVSSNPDALLATVRSRCARVQFGPVPAAPDPRTAAMIEDLERAVGAADEREALFVAGGFEDRDSALAAAQAFYGWTRDLLVVQAGGAADLAALEAKAKEASAQAAPFALLQQAKLCADVIEALEQNGNGRLQIERLLLGARELRHG